MKVTLRYDDRHGNGHPTFSITAEIRENGILDSCGCLHDEIAAYFPELESCIKWHLASSDEPMHYLENTMYWLGYQGYCDRKQTSPPNLEFARKTACWPDMPAEYVCPLPYVGARPRNGETFANEQDIRAALTARLPALRTEFLAAMAALGLA